MSHVGEMRVRDANTSLERLNNEFEDANMRLQAVNDELAATNDRLEAVNADLLRSNRDLEQFAYVASHDLQEPLRMVASFLQLLDRRYAEKLDDTAREYIGFAVDGAARMKVLINDLLAFSRVGTRATEPTAVSAAEVVGAVLADMEPVIRELGVEVSVGPLPTVMADRGQLHQVFQNLIGNALKFRRGDPPTVRIAAASDADGWWRLSMSDNGIGIAPDHLTRIFEIFKRLHSREAYPGTGIGLAVCLRIVERHGGRIWVESKPGHGTAVHFTMPDPGGTP